MSPVLFGNCLRARRLADIYSVTSPVGSFSEAMWDLTTSLHPHGAQPGLSHQHPYPISWSASRESSLVLLLESLPNTAAKLNVLTLRSNHVTLLFTPPCGFLFPWEGTQSPWDGSKGACNPHTPSGITILTWSLTIVPLRPSPPASLAFCPSRERPAA